MRRHYVYYRVLQGHLADATTAVSALQATLRSRHAGLQAELLRRPGATAGMVTLMEIYGGIDDAQAAAIEADALATLSPWIAGERHVEVFETIG